MSRITIKQLLLAGSHFGHLTRRWNPRMRPYIFMQKNGVHILDLKKTHVLLEEACNRMGSIVAKGGDVLFVGTKDQARDVIKEEAERCGMYYVNERWLGGMLTNFRTIRNSIRTLETLEAKAKDGTYDRIRKKEILSIERQKEKLLDVLGGIRNMKRLPQAMFVVDTVKEDIAIKEARKLGIPVFAICDSNSDPSVVDYVIPANDDAYKSIAVITNALAESIEEGRVLRKESSFGQEGEQDGPEGDAHKPAARRRRKKEGTVAVARAEGSEGADEAAHGEDAPAEGESASE
jgi:small subunit ribosomal protein S2